MNKIHIGYPKTGSTYLQKHVFTQIKNLEFLGHKEFVESGLFNLLWRIERAIDYDFIFNYIKDKRFFISFEEITGPSMQGSLVMDEIPLRLKKALKQDIKVLITIRRQDTLIKSLYLQYLHLGGTLSFKNIINNKNFGQSRIETEAYNFYKTYIKYCEIFGSENVVIIPYEYLLESPKLFKKHLELFFENEVFDLVDNKNENRSVKGLQVKYLRFVNNFLDSWVSEKYIVPSSLVKQNKFRLKLQKSNFLRFGKSFNENENKLSQIILKQFYVSNKALDEKLDLNLKKYGYYK
jgi:hypothetical protein